MTREKPLSWCAELAGADLDHVAAALAEALDRARAKAPDAVRIAVLRSEHREDGTVACWLHVAVVFEGAAAHQRGAIEDTHPALARELQRAAERWTGAWPVLHRRAEGDAALAHYRTPRPYVVLPTEPLRRVPASLPTTAPVAPPPPPPPPAPTAPASPPIQRSLF